MKRISLVALALAAVTALIVSACGGGAEPTATPTPGKPAATPVAAATATPQPSPTPAPPTPTSAGPQPKYGGILRARIGPTEPTTWLGLYNPLAYSVLSHLIWFYRGSLTKIAPDLAESWELGADGKTYTFKLHKDVKWHDGAPFTSADVLYTFKRVLDRSDVTFASLAGGLPPLVAAIATVDAPDPATFRVTLKQPSVSFLSFVAGPKLLIFPAHIPDKPEWKDAVGTGPFALKEHISGASFSVKKNPNYHLKDGAGRALPYMDGIDWTVIVDPALALAAFRTGRHDCGCSYDHDYQNAALETLKKEIPGLTYGIFHSHPAQVQFNLQRPPFNILAFRQAVSIALNKDEMAALNVGGSIHKGGHTYTPVPPLHPPELGGQWGLPKEELIKFAGYNPDHRADLATARAKLAEAGLDPAKVKFEIAAGAFAPFRLAVEAAAGVLRQELRFDVSVSLNTGPEQTAKLRRGDFDANWYAVGMGIDDPGDYFTAGFITGGAINYGKYSNPRMDQLLFDQDREFDPAKRRALLWAIQRIHLTEFPGVPVYTPGFVQAVRPDVKNFRFRLVSFSNEFRLEEVWLER